MEIDYGSDFKMNDSTKKKLRTIRDRILWEKFFFNRGKSIWSDLPELLTLTTVVGLFVNLINNIAHTNFNVGKAMMGVPIVMITYWLTGRGDYKKLHIIQKENEIALMANPALYEKVCKIVEDIKEIKKKLL